MTVIDPVERHLFFEGILLKYGYDFRQYSEASLDRRLSNLIEQNQMTSLLDLLKKVLSSGEFFRTVLPLMTINTTEFFRDPLFFKCLRETVAPILKTYPKISVWIAGCSTGQEALSVAIMLDEEGLLTRSTIYATDINHEVLKVAREGIYDNACIQAFNANYVQAGGLKSPSDYYSADYGLVRFDRKLLQNIVFTEHNLATDSVFIEAHLILCRNVLIYFSRTLQDHVYDLFTRSLVYKGILGIGSKESIRFSSVENIFDSLVPDQHVYSLKSRSRNRDAGARLSRE